MKLLQLQKGVVTYVIRRLALPSSGNPQESVHSRNPGNERKTQNSVGSLEQKNEHMFFLVGLLVT